MKSPGEAAAETFRVQFDEALARMFEEETGLAGADQLGSRTDYLQYVWDFPHPRNPLYRRFRRVFRGWPSSTVGLQTIINDDRWWYPFPHMRIVFKALAYAENQFACTYPPCGSHEERLTGHLLTECFSALRTVSEEVGDVLSRTFGVRMELELAYSDLSAGSVVSPDGTKTIQEKVTGADFALLVTHQSPGARSPVTTGTAFQAKKAGLNGTQIDLPQLAALGKYAGWSGSRYCFYDMDTGRQLAPFVVGPGDIWKLDANPFSSEDVRKLEPSALKRRKGSVTVQPVELGRSTLAEYLVFGMTLLGQGATYDSLYQAYQEVVLGGDGGSPAGRVLALTFRPHGPQDEGESVLRYMAK